MGWSATNLFSKKVTEEPAVKIKRVGNYMLIVSDNVKRSIADCPYTVNYTKYY